VEFPPPFNRIMYNKRELSPKVDLLIIELYNLYGL